MSHSDPLHDMDTELTLQTLYFNNKSLDVFKNVILIILLIYGSLFNSSEFYSK